MTMMAGTKHEWVVWYNWAIMIITAIASFVPMFAYGAKWQRGYPVGDFSYLKPFTNSTLSSAEVYAITQDDEGTFQLDTQVRSTGAAVFLGMALPTALDLIAELYITWSSAEKGEESIHVVRLSWAERVAFVAGVFCFGSICFVPSSSNIFFRWNFDVSFESASTILTVGPVLLFLQRHTESFSDLWTAFLMSLMCTGVLIYNAGYMEADPSIIAQLYLIGGWMVGAQSVLIILTCVWCLVKYYRERQSGDPSDAYNDFCANHVRMFGIVRGTCALSLYSDIPFQ